jgi:ATP-dependent RNA helicase DHR2
MAGLAGDDEGIPIARTVLNQHPKTSSTTPSKLNAGKKRKRTAQQHSPATGNEFGKSKKPNENSSHTTKSKFETTSERLNPKQPTSFSTRISADHGANSVLRRKKDKLLEFRRQLPIWPKADYIRTQLKNRDVLILVGETGSGKSTQVPQFLLDEAWCKGGIAITQPRRVAAISLARRVAEEMGSPLGSASPSSKVGYSVRFDKSTSANTKVLYLTEGMLLQEMLRDPALKAFSTVIVDEVHERSVNVDLLLGFLRNLLIHGSKLRNGKPLKVIVMSATADVTALSDFFEAGFLELSALDMEISSTEVQKHISNGGDASDPSGSTRVGICHIEGRLFPVKVTHLSEPTQDFVEAALKCIFQIHYKEPLPGDILVFLTGQDTVESLERLVNEYADSLGPEVPKVVSSFNL